MTIFVAKYDLNGNYVWAKKLGFGEGKSVFVNLNGIYIAGRFSGSSDFDPGINVYNLTSYGSWDAFICKLNFNGDLEWAKNFGGSGDEESLSIHVDNSGYIYHTGFMNGISDFDPDLPVYNLSSNGNKDVFVNRLKPCFPTSSNITAEACVNYELNGTVYTSTGTYTQVIEKPDGCDSTITLDLIINPLPSPSISTNSPLCSGQTLQLNSTPNGMSNYAWSGPNGFSSPLQNASISNANISQTGTYTLTVIDNNGCTNTETSNVIVNEIPTVSGGSNFAICAGNQATLNGNGNAVSYNWNNGVQNGVSFIPTSTDTYIVTGTDANNCTNTAQVTITVNPLPNVNAGQDQLFCFGGTISLSGSGANSYFWNNGIQNNVPFTPTQTLTYTVTGTDVNNCQNTDDVTITVLTSPIQEVCVVTVDELLADHNIVFWEKPANLGNIDSFYVYREISTNFYQKIGAKHVSELSEYYDYGANPNSTSYRYKISTIDTCGNESDFGLFHESIHLLYIGSGNFFWTYYNIENTPNQVASYNFWRDNAGDGSNWQILQTVSGTSNTFTDVDYVNYPNAIYRVDLNWINQNECTATRANINTSRSNTKGTVAAPVDAIYETFEQLINVYPNPATDWVAVNLPAVLVGKTYTLTNSMGQVMQKNTLTSTQVDINMGDLANGIYYLQVETTVGSVTKKIVKQ
jgi:hypothetical protein